MGTWGADSFQNDWAMDWLGDLCEGQDGSPIRIALSSVVEHCGTEYSSPSLLEQLRGGRRPTDCLKARVAAKALAAAEVVAAWRGRPSETLPADLIAWLQQNKPLFPSEIVPLAKRAVGIVKINSELKDLWEEHDASEWKSIVENLEQRLN